MVVANLREFESRLVAAVSCSASSLARPSVLFPQAAMVYTIVDGTTAIWAGSILHRIVCSHRLVDRKHR